MGAPAITSKSVRLAVLLVLATVIALSFSTPAASADRGNTIKFSIFPDTTTTTVQVLFHSNRLPDGSIIRIHIDVSISPVRTKPNKPTTLIWSNDAYVTVLNGFAQATFVVPLSGPGWYLYQVYAYDSAHNLLAYAWRDPREGTGP